MAFVRKGYSPWIGRSGFGRYAVLWIALLAISAAIVLPSEVPVAGSSPLLAVAVATLSAAVGLALLQLGILRFLTLGDVLDLCVGLAFGTLALANLVVRLAAPVVGMEPSRPEVTLGLILLTRAIAAALFLGGLIRRPPVKRTARARAAQLLAGVVIGVLVLIGSAIVVTAPLLPPALDAAALALLAADALVVDVLPGQAPWLLTINALLALMMVLTTLGYAVLARQRQDRHLDALTIAVSLLTFGQLHTLLFPPVALDYVSVASGFRLMAYLVLLHDLVARIGRDIADQASQQERLRLSRDLHDGLAQHLGLLTLRLSRAQEPQRPVERRARDLQAATRLVEVATLEARQAILALRGGTITWDELCYAVGVFADDFGRNHEITIDVQTEGRPSAEPVDAALQVDLLRILHEACSNAVRHGAATRVTIDLTALAVSVTLCIRDDGSGFDPTTEAPTRGVGLRSMRDRVEGRGGTFVCESAPGQGVMLRARLPLRPPLEVEP